MKPPFTRFLSSKLSPIPVTLDPPLHSSSQMSVNWDPSLAKTRYQVDAATIYQIVWTALLFWDWFITLPLEVRAIWRAKTTVLKVTFLFQRYGTLLFMLIASYLLLHDVPMRICKKAFWLETLGLVYVLITSDILLSIRVWALFDRSRISLILLSLLLGIELALLLTASSFVKPLNIPREYALMTDSTGCIAGDPVGDLGGFAVLFYAVPFGVNCLLLAATAYRSWKVSRQLDGIKLPTHCRLLNDGAVYFVCITVINAINVYFYCQPNEVLKSSEVPAVIVVSSTLSCRLALSLHKEKPPPSLASR